MIKLEDWPCRIDLKEQEPYTEPIEVWCHKNIKKSWAMISTIDGVYFLFIEETDAIKFALRWGG